VESRRSHDEDAAVDEQREHKREGRVERRELDGLRLPDSSRLKFLVCTIELCR